MAIPRDGNPAPTTPSVPPSLTLWILASITRRVSTRRVIARAVHAGSLALRQVICNSYADSPKQATILETVQR